MLTAVIEEWDRCPDPTKCSVPLIPRRQDCGEKVADLFPHAPLRGYPNTECGQALD
jgi:hypothetical protein